MSLPGALASIERLFAHNAQRTPAALALTDPPDRARFTPDAPRRLTYAQAEAAVAAATMRLHELGLSPGSVVALRFPNVCDSVVALLAVMRAGLIPAMIPGAWPKEIVVAAVSAVDAGAFITLPASRDAHADFGLVLAAEAPGLRYVCGFGSNLPDGYVPLDDAVSGQAQAQAAPSALITFDLRSGQPAPMVRSHIEVLAGGLAVMLEAGLQRRAVLLSTILPGSFGGIAASMIPWLLTGGVLALHQPFDAQTLGAQVDAEAADVLVIPGAVLDSLGNEGRVAAWASRGQTLALWPDYAVGAEKQSAPSGRITDILRLGEWALVPRRRLGPMPEPLRAGLWRPTSATQNSPALLQIHRTMHQTIEVSGPMVPHRAASDGRSIAQDADNAIDTGLPWPGEAAPPMRTTALEHVDHSVHIEASRAFVA